MYGKKTRIISFLMAFLLIFTFAFINPLTMSKSEAVFPAVALTAHGVKIIAGVLVSSGILITAGTTLQETDYESAVTAISNVVYRTLNGAEKIALCALSILDNIVEVPVTLYNSIVSKAKKVFETTEYSQSLISQGISIKYTHLSSDNSYDPDLYMPVYQLTNVLSDGWVTTREIDMREAEPFLVYDGSQSEIDSFGQAECITTNYFDFSSEDNPLIEAIVSSSYNEGMVVLTPSIRGYNMKYSSSDYLNCFYLINFNGIINLCAGYALNGSISYNDSLIDLNKEAWFSSIPFTSLSLYYYLVRNVNGYVGIHADVYTDGEFIGQRQYILENAYDFNSIITSENLYDTPSGLDSAIIVEETPTSVVTNTDATANVLTLPVTTSEVIGLTSTDVNVEVESDIPGTDTGTGENTGNNTETMDNINTNVGELVTGGTLGEQVNTNIGTVEGLHGEITEQVDFGAVFDTIAQYISALDISSVTWFPVAVASFISPFLPVISLGIILFFIDRVLNGGA